MSSSKLSVRPQSDLPGVIEAPAPSDPHIVVHVGRSIEIECQRGGGRYRGRAVHGHVDIIPAGIASRWVVTEPGNALIVRVSQDLLRATTEESGADSARVTLFNRFQARDPQIEQLAWALKAEMDGGYPSGGLYLDGLGLALASRLVHRHSSLARETAVTPAGGLSGRRLRQVLSYIEDNLGHELSLGGIACAGGLSISHCQRAFRRAMGVSVHRYVIQRRVERAESLLVEGSRSIGEVALDVGFSHQSHLAYHMRRLRGVLPSNIARTNGHKKLS